MIIEKSTGRVLYVEDFQINANGVIGDGFIDSGTTTENANVVDTPELPEDFVCGQSTYNNGSWVHPAPEIEPRRELLLAEAKEKRATAFYTNVTIPFPIDEKEIHFRNESDRANIGDKTLACISKIIAGNTSAEIEFTPVDGVTVTMTVSQLAGCFAAIGQIKDDLWYSYKTIIDSIKEAANNSDLDAAESALNSI